MSHFKCLCFKVSQNILIRSMCCSKFENYDSRHLFMYSDKYQYWYLWSMMGVGMTYPPGSYSRLQVDIAFISSLHESQFALDIDIMCEYWRRERTKEAYNILNSIGLTLRSNTSTPLSLVTTMVPDTLNG